MQRKKKEYNISTTKNKYPIEITIVNCQNATR